MSQPRKPEPPPADAPKVGTLPTRTAAATPSTNVAATTKPRLTVEEQRTLAINDRLNRGVFLQALADVLPRHVKPETMVRTALLAATTRPELLNCTPESIAQAVLQISAWGLEIGRTAHIVAYQSVAQAQQDYKGMIERAIRARAITRAYTRVIYQGDEIEIEYGLTERLVHKPKWDATGTRTKLGVYSVVVLPSGETDFEVMNAEQIAAVRTRSKSAKSGKGPWITDEDEMWRKTVLRRHFKRIPQAAEIAEADDDEYLEKLAAEAQRVASGVTARAKSHAPGGFDHITTRGDTGYGGDPTPQGALGSGAPQAAPAGAGPQGQGQGGIEPQAGAQATAGASREQARGGLAAQPDAYTTTLEAEDAARRGSDEPPSDGQGYPMVGDGAGGWRERTDAERQDFDREIDRAIAESGD